MGVLKVHGTIVVIVCASVVRVSSVEESWTHRYLVSEGVCTQMRVEWRISCGRVHGVVEHVRRHVPIVWKCHNLSFALPSLSLVI